MIELIQFPWSPFCLVQRRILEFAGAKFKITNIPNGDRSMVWKLSRERYYQVPLLKDGRTVVFEVGEDSQIIAKYLDEKFAMDLFPRAVEGLQRVLWRHIESEIEDLTFRLTDIYWRELVPPADRLLFVRHKERKFGRGCLDQWRHQRNVMLAELTHRLGTFELMLSDSPFLLDRAPRFVDFDLHGMLANFLYTGHYRLPPRHTRLRQWFALMSRVRFSEVNSA